MLQVQEVFVGGLPGKRPPRRGSLLGPWCVRDGASIWKEHPGRAGVGVVNQKGGEKGRGVLHRVDAGRRSGCGASLLPCGASI